MNDARLATWRDQYRDALLNDIEPWWSSRFIDDECGGYRTYRDHDGSLLSDEKSIWVLGRIIWMWSRLYNTVEKRDAWLNIARHGIDFMLEHAFDDDGRMFFRVERDGKPIQKRRYLFSECFGAIAFAEYARASGSDEMLQRARDLYRLILRYHRAPGLLPPKQMRPLKGHAMPMILLATSQVMRSVDDDSLYDDVIQQSLDEVMRDFVKPDKQCLLEVVYHDGSILDTPEGRTVNPGHAIETSWFMLEEARHRNNDRALIEQACRIMQWSFDIGWDKEHGGLLYFVDCDGKPAEPYEHELKLWWPMNEANYATLLAYHMTDDPAWLDRFTKVHDWSWSHFPDAEHGEWFGYLRRDGTISSRIKGNHWKGPFHLPRMLLNTWQLLETLSAATDAPRAAS